MTEAVPAAEDEDASEGLRARNRERTAKRLEEAAWEIVSEKGFDAVTADAVADRAGVSRRTFFNYYPRVELVLQERMRAAIAGLVDRFIARPADEDLECSLDAVLSEPFDAELLDKAVIVFGQSPISPAARFFLTEAQDMEIAQVAEALQRRGEPWTDPVAAQVVARAVMGACYIATVAWLDRSRGIVNDRTRRLHLAMLRQACAELFITFGGGSTLAETGRES